jgi:hypothetical protein
MAKPGGIFRNVHFPFEGRANISSFHAFFSHCVQTAPDLVNNLVDLTTKRLSEIILNTDRPGKSTF